MKDKILRLVNSKSYLVFDFDGVILDSVGIKADAFASLYAEYGSDVVANVVSYHEKNGGMSRFEKFDYYHNKLLGCQISDSEIDILDIKFSKMVLDRILTAKEIKGAITFLERSVKDGKTCVINSATPEGELRSIVKQRRFAKYFDLVLGSPLTKVQNLSKIKSKINCEYSEMIFFGDAVSDFEAARLAGVDFVGVGEAGSILGRDKYECLLIPDFGEIL